MAGNAKKKSQVDRMRIRFRKYNQKEKRRRFRCKRTVEIAKNVIWRKRASERRSFEGTEYDENEVKLHWEGVDFGNNVSDGARERFQSEK